MQFPIQEKFELSKAFLESYRGLKPKWGFNGLGEFVFMRTYSRIRPDGKNESWHDTVQRVVEGLYSIQKQHIKDYNLGWNQTKAQKSAQEMYERIFNFKMLPPGRSLWAMGSDIVMVRGLTEALYNCFSGKEKFLTETGYFTFEDASKEGTKTVRSLSGEWVNAEVKNFGKQKIVELHLNRSGTEDRIIETTENHLWFAKSKSDLNRHKAYSLVTTKELKAGSRLQYEFGNHYIKPSPQGIQHGFCFGDGTKGRIDLQLGKDEDLLKYFGENRLVKKETFYQVLDLPLHYKELPSKKWDRKYLYGWLMGYFSADGSVINGQVTIASSKKENLEAFKEIGEMCGIASYEIRKSSSQSTNYCDNRELYEMTLIPNTLTTDFFILEKHKENFISKGKYNYWKVVKIVYTDRVEDVYCAVVPEKESFVLTDGILTHNCSYLSTKNIAENPGLPFGNAMDFLMLGVGVGFDVQGAGKIDVKPRKEMVHHYQIPDSREGWVESTIMLINSFFGYNNYEFDYSIIRPAGSPIRTFGGVSAGATPLIELHNGIVSTLEKNVGSPITATSIADIINMVGRAVVSGNVRRSAEIILGNNDNEFLNLKNYEVNPERSAYGWASNNSVYAELGMDYSDIAKRIVREAEPGVFWKQNAQRFGRMRLTESDWKDKRVEGLNPCAEITLEPSELCNLAELFPHNHDSLDDFKKTIKYAYLYAKTITLLNTNWPETNKVMLRNRRIGLSMTGIVQFVSKHGMNELKKWMEEGYSTAEYYDDVYSDWLAIPKSKKLTTIKPSGTISLLAGATPGIHYPESKYYIRRVRLSSNSPYIEILKNGNYKVEPSNEDPKGTFVVEFPVSAGDQTKTINEVSMWEQLNLAEFAQENWADNSVSVTVTFKKEEAQSIEAALDYYQFKLKAVSFLPKLEEGAYAQMPYEEITKEEYELMVHNIIPLDFSNMFSVESIGEKYCSNDGCSI